MSCRPTNKRFILLPNFIQSALEFQTGRNYYVDLKQSFLALKLKNVTSRGYETYTNKEVKKEHKEETKTYDEIPNEEEVEKAPVPLVTHINNTLH